MAKQRINESFLAIGERALLHALVRRLPSFAAPDHLTALGLLGAIGVAFGFIACRWSNWWLIAVMLGLFLNWFGDSLDGTLARFRNIERPHYGYFVDHSTDLIAQTLIVIGLGLSPYFTIASALLVLSLYLLMSSYTYLRVVTESIHRLSYGGMGATEFRLLVAAWALFAAAMGPGLTQARFMNFAMLDIVIGVLSACTFAGFVWVVWSDLARMQAAERALLEATEKAQAPRAEAEIFSEHNDLAEQAR